MDLIAGELNFAFALPAEPGVFVLKVSGKGRVYLQSRSIGGLASWINSHLWGR
jgi:uncharacterized protein (AIM24 family)